MDNVCTGLAGDALAEYVLGGGLDRVSDIG